LGDPKSPMMVIVEVIAVGKRENNLVYRLAKERI
jgi:hypothetical protein